MAEKTGTSGAAGRASAAGQPDSVRNVVLVGHSGAGKTTLVEALLVSTGTIQRAGRVEDGTTVSDFDEVEVRQQRSVNLTLAPVTFGGVKVNLLDTPGYADFTGDLRAGLRAADAALFTVSAAEGVDGLTRMLWEECAAVGMPRAVVITKIDHQRGDFAEALALVPGSLRRLGRPAVPAGHRRPGRRQRADRAAVRALLRLLGRLPRGARPRPGRRRPDRGGAQRADRGDHPGERGREPHGPVPVR